MLHHFQRAWGCNNEVAKVDLIEEKERLQEVEEGALPLTVEERSEEGNGEGKGSEQGRQPSRTTRGRSSRASGKIGR